MRVRLFGQPLAPRVVIWGVVSGVAALALQLALPFSVVLFGADRRTIGLVVLAATLLVSGVRAIAAERTAAAVRGVVYDGLVAAIRGRSVVPPVAARDAERIGSDVARAAPWVEVLFAVTAPTLAASIVSLAVVALLTAYRFGAEALGVGALTLAGGVALGVSGARTAARAADRAWEAYDGVGSLIERGVRAPAELRANGLSDAVEARLRTRVEQWSRLERRAYFLSALTGRSVPAVVVVVAFLVALAVGIRPSHTLARVFGDPQPRDVVAVGLALAVLPILTEFSHAIATTATLRRHFSAIRRLVETGGATNAPLARVARPIDDIRVRRASYRYPSSDATVSADFVWRRGESLALVGPTGSGKTTVALLVMGLVEPRAGAVVGDMGGREVPIRLAGARFGYLAQQVFFDEQETVLEAVRLFAPASDERAILGLLGRFWAGELDAAILRRRVRELSGGQRRLVALARVLLSGAELLVLDEPEASLDVDAQQRVRTVLAEQATRSRMLLLTHRPELAALATRVLRFEAGHQVAERALSEHPSALHDASGPIEPGPAAIDS